MSESLFPVALKAHIPIVGVHTDDLPNLERALQLIALQNGLGQKAVAFDDQKSTTVLLPGLYYTLKEENVSVATYQRLAKHERSLVLVNPKTPSSLVMDAGLLLTPAQMIDEYLTDMQVPHADQSVLRAVLKGLSLKAATEVMRLTIARTGGWLPLELRRTRLQISGGVQGLFPMEVLDEFYAWPPELETWMDMNAKYFDAPGVPHKLVPRGVMLAGPPGTGKTMAARAVAQRLGVPLYRLDVATALNRYIGESENRIARSLALAEQESPCVVLIDEVEKVFTTGTDDNGVVTRILSQLLWWLGDHRSTVLTVMTTNDLHKLPPELYRPGRLDMVLHLPKLTLQQAKGFITEVFLDVVGDKPGAKHREVLEAALDATSKADLAHSEVAELCYEQIKRNDWI